MVSSILEHREMMAHALSLPIPDIALFSHSTYRSPHRWECLRHAGWTDREMDEWVDAQLCPGRVSIGLVLYWSDYHSLLSPHGFLISPNLFLQVLKDSVKAEYSGSVPGYREGRSYFAMKKNSSQNLEGNSENIQFNPIIYRWEKEPWKVKCSTWDYVAG